MAWASWSTVDHTSPTEDQPGFADLLTSGLGVDADTILYSSGPIVVRLIGLSLMSFLAARLVRRAIRRIDDDRTRRQLDFFVPKLVRIVVVAVGLEVAGIDITGMAAILTTVGFTGAVVFTPLGQNIVAGLVTTLDDLFDVGDVIEVDEIYGTVLSRSLLRTELRRPDGSTVWIPNKMLSDQLTLNHSRLGGFRIDVEVPLDHNPDRQRAVAVMEPVLARLPWTVAKHRSFLCFEEVAGEAVIYRAYAWIEDRATEPIYRSKLLTALVDALEADGFSVGHTTNLSMHPADNRMVRDRP